VVCRFGGGGDGEGGLVFTTQIELFKDQERNPMFATGK
jgi:hypothetical protein